MCVKECNVHLDQRKDDYVPGDVVSGQVNYVLEENTEFKEISLSLKGRGRCVWTESTGNQTVTYLGTEKHFTQTATLLNETSPDAIVTLAPGSYTHNFQFLLPKDIPHSYRKGPSFISYCLKLAFVRPDFWKRDEVFKTEIRVRAHVDIGSDVFAAAKYPSTAILKKPIYNIFIKAGNLDMRVHIPKTVYLPGEVVQLECEVDNSSTLSLPGLKTKLIRVTVSVPGMRRNSLVDIPLVIGTGVGPRRLADPGTSSSSAPLSSYPLQPPVYSAHEEDLPPSYWEVMEMHTADHGAPHN